MRLIKVRILYFLALFFIKIYPGLGSQDPKLQWQTLETPHFRIHFHQGLLLFAFKIARLAEKTHKILSPAMNWEPSEPCHIVLIDNADYAQGMGGALPYNAIWLHISLPSELSDFEDYEDWFFHLLLHEYTHVLHSDTILGIPTIINKIFGKVYSPNLMQPRWLIEGLAIYHESRHTTKGRIKSSLFDMYLRMDVLEDNMLKIDQLSAGLKRWPYNKSYYLYGGFFIEYIAKRFGEEALAKLSLKTGSNPLPFEVNRNFQRVLKYDLIKLYNEWQEELKKNYLKQKRRLSAQGLTKENIISKKPGIIRYPRFSPKQRYIIYLREAEDSFPSLIANFLDSKKEKVIFEFPKGGIPEGTEPTLAFMPNSRYLLFSQTQTYKNYYFYNDIYLLDLKSKETKRLTFGLRATNPAPAPDGTKFAFVAQKDRVSHLMIYDLSLKKSKTIFKAPYFGKIYSPRWSPDGKFIAFSMFTPRKYRDLFIIEVSSKRISRITQDQALDTAPCWSPDQKYLLFSSDKTGIFNLYAYQMQTKEFYQVTNVISGAFQPDISPNGKYIVYVGYSSKGYDLRLIKFDPSTWKKITKTVEKRPQIDSKPLSRSYQIKPYNPFLTFYPQTWSLWVGERYKTTTLEISTQAEDVVGNHYLRGNLDIKIEEKDVDYMIGYIYKGINPDLIFQHSRSLLPQFRQTSEGVKEYLEQRLKGAIGINFPINQAESIQRIGLNYTASWAKPLDSNFYNISPDKPYYPLGDYFLSGFELSWLYSNLKVSPRGFDWEKGIKLRLGMNLHHSVFGSNLFRVDFRGGISKYLKLPWARFHVLALNLEGGISTFKNMFSIGGFPAFGFQEMTEILLLGQSTPFIPLRGYRFAGIIGEKYHLLNVEYRFKIIELNRGVYTLPIFLAQIYSLGFIDIGNAYEGEFRFRDLKMGVGFELLFNFVLGYTYPLTLRFGYAKGVSLGGIHDFYIFLGHLF
jgi:Tol biopolymer transport system component